MTHAFRGVLSRLVSCNSETFVNFKQILVPPGQCNNSLSPTTTSQPIRKLSSKKGLSFNHDVDDAIPPKKVKQPSRVGILGVPTYLGQVSTTAFVYLFIAENSVRRERITKIGQRVGWCSSGEIRNISVSYTHLTLPTILLV